LVHSWLEAAHRRCRPCTAGDLPDPATLDAGASVGDAAPGGSAPEAGTSPLLLADLSAQDYATIHPFLAAHLPLCPLTGEHEDVRPEPQVVAHDTSADVVVVTMPDLLVTRDGRTVWRETKTVHAARPLEAETVLQVYPQIALGLCLLADTTQPETAPGLVELEILAPDGGTLFSFDAGDADLVARARATLTELAGDWHEDRHFDPRPGPACAHCPVSRWCPVAGDQVGPQVAVVGGVHIDMATGEVLAPAPSARS
jgi:hypothetical protein